MGESSKGDASFVKDDLLNWSKKRTLFESFLEEALFKELCADGMVTGATPSIEHIDLIYTESLDLALFHLPCFPPPPLICLQFKSS